MIQEEDIAKIRGKGVVPEFQFNRFPPSFDNIYTAEIVKLVADANREIGNLNSYAKIVPNPDLLIAPLLLREALDSSKIEGTRATARDIVEKEAGVELPFQLAGEALEVINHREAIKLGIKMMSSDNMPLVNRVINRMHVQLLNGVRGSTHRLGEFRQGSNVVATREDINSVIYLPPEAKYVEKLMRELESYMNVENPKEAAILRCAALHYEFEAVHPFADGNGRLGRVLIPLYLIKENILEYPFLYLSGYLLNRRQSYYEHLLNITISENWISWIKFFLEAVVIQAKKSKELLDKIYSLYKEYEEHAENEIKSHYIHKIVEQTFRYPVITTSLLQEAMPILGRPDTAMVNLRKLANIGLLREDVTKKRDIPFYNEALIKLLEEA